MDMNLTLMMLNLYISCSENSVDPDQLASEKPADQDPHCFPLRSSEYMLISFNWGKMERSIVHKNIQHG